ncbi:serine/threonine protein kinase [Nonomuraea sp. SYSU D8015]|uniref:serine/threonine protein kinase n=1 Tax=Nonomuraea sp. SYSU D8015 TaxID=2593644 RepID=UPI001660987D|nr:protein kinase [Nonomuraea sp. SYSU D8015]
MPEITDLRAGDPGEVADYRLMGRLGSGVYLGQSRTGEPAVVRVLPAEVEPEPFLQAMEPFRDVSAVGTAQILATGALEGQAYVVTEYVEGPALKDVGGTVDGVGLYRLAVGTITALVTIHQAGLVHGDIRPGNVVLGPDGPRLINPGLEQATAGAAISTRKVAVPAFSAPERLRGATAEAPADVFSWAATMVFAVSGASPFEGGSMGATVDRIVKGEPSLPDLGELHELLAACLAKDPAARPAASEVLLRLVGQTSFLTGQVRPQAPPQTAPSPRRPGLVPLAAAFAAGALLSGAGVYAVVDARTPPRTAAAATTPSATAPLTITPSTTVAPKEKVAPKAASTLPLPAISATFYEHPDDHVRLTAYLEATGKYTGHVRDRAGTFKAVSTTEEPVVSPDGDWVALNPWVKYQNSDTDFVKLTRLSTGESFTVTTVKKPLQTMNPVWSRDGTKLLLTAVDLTKKPYTTRDFVLIDLQTRKASHVSTEYQDDASLIFTFTPDGTIARGFFGGERTGIDYYNTSGQVIKSLHWVGMPRGRDWFSPSGKQFVTVCPKSAKELCVWDARTGARRATVPRKTDEGDLLGWFNENHLLVREPGKKKGIEHINIIDFVGATERVLADVSPLKGQLQFAAAPR